MKLTLGVMTVKLKHAFMREGVVYYQRAIPTDLRDRYPSRLIKQSLGTDDVIKAKREIERLDRQYEAEWELMRKHLDATPKSISGQAIELLRAHGLSADATQNDELAIELFRDRLTPEQTDADSVDPVESRAWQIIAGTVKPTIETALTFYLETHPKAGTKRFEEHARGVIKTLTDVTGDKAIVDLSREDARKYVIAQIDRGVKTGTVSRYLNSIRAIIAMYFREHEIDKANPFTRITIPNNGEDAKKRLSFTDAELQTMFAACRGEDDDVRWALAMIGDTGARLAEVIGLGLEDIVVGGDTPHMVIESRPWRPIKTADSARSVPLTGYALWAAQRIKETAHKAQRFAFPRYTSPTKTKADSASATTAKWLRSIGLDHSAHELRHSMKDRLREVQAPEDIQKAILGHASGDVASRYGSRGYGLTVMKDWLEKVAL
ncbi:DUF6538 domain-containing protein [Ralstonia pseudosolanacearum]|uniref:DUF6538 domain-containing protein n=1 Tax=Ralstonia pseudosolanacearum TaxID=1310165 RepID=UPI003AAAEF53